MQSARPKAKVNVDIDSQLFGDIDLAAYEADRSQAIQSDSYCVWYENWDAFVEFVGLRTQLQASRLITLGKPPLVTIWEGLDYQSVTAVLQLKYPRNRAQKMFEKIQNIEHGALLALNDQPLPDDDEVDNSA